MSSPKTQPTGASVDAFIDALEHPQRRDDARVLLDVFKRVTGEQPVMWGDSMIGFGTYYYKSERSTQEGDWFITGFSPRKTALSLYVLTGFSDQSELLDALGPHKKGVGCLYLKNLADVDTKVLERLIAHTYAAMKERYP